MYTINFRCFFAKIWPEKTTSRDGRVLLTKIRVAKTVFLANGGFV